MVVPLHKKKSKTNVENYRPISVLSIISRVFKKILFIKLSDFLMEHKLLCEFQPGFGSLYSTDTCLIHLTDYNLQKVFDTMDHAILLKKPKGVVSRLNRAV